MSSAKTSVADKVAIITGSGRQNGIGAAIALALAREGAKVTINYLSDTSASRAADVKAKIESEVGTSKIIIIQTNVSTPKGAKKIISDTLTKFNVDHINIVVNNASYMIGGPVLSSEPQEILKSFDVGVVGPILLTQEAYPHMPNHSRVINIGSVASKLGFGPMPIYGAVKAAMDQITWSLAREMGRDGKQITVNTIAPGPVLTDSLPDVPQVQPIKDFLVALTRAEERVGTVDDIADAVLLLTSEKSRWITGQFISVSGGINGG